MQSVKNKTLSICDFVLSNDYDLVALTETWLGSSVDEVCVSELVPSGYEIKHVPRCGRRRGGGVAVIFKSALQLKVVATSKEKEFSQFEYMDCSVSVRGYTTRLAIIYRPPPSKGNSLSATAFLEEEWPTFLSKYVTIDKNIILVGDLNFHLDVPSNRESLRLSNFLAFLMLVDLNNM